MLSITISYFGLSCFKIEVKDREEAVFITDPFDKSAGLNLPRNFTADGVTVSSDSELHNATDLVKPTSEKGKFKIINNSGEYEVKNVFVNGATFFTKDKNDKIIHKNNVFQFVIDDIKITHLGSLARAFTNDEIQTMESCDVLLLPISSDPDISAKGGSALPTGQAGSGGKNDISPKSLIEIVSQIDPRIIIPMHYKMPGLKTNLNPLDKFLKEIGKSKFEEMKKFKFAKKDLPAEETRVVVLTRE